MACRHRLTLSFDFAGRSPSTNAITVSIHTERVPLNLSTCDSRADQINRDKCIVFFNCGLCPCTVFSKTRHHHSCSLFSSWNNPQGADSNNMRLHAMLNLYFISHRMNYNHRHHYKHVSEFSSPSLTPLLFPVFLFFIHHSFLLPIILSIKFVS